MMTSILLRSYVGNGDCLVWLEDDNEGILRSQLAHTCGVGSGRRKHLIEGGERICKRGTSYQVEPLGVPGRCSLDLASTAAVDSWAKYM